MSQLKFDMIGKVQKMDDFIYSWKDAALYAVGIGAQAEELSFVYERTPGGLKVFPSFATIAAGSALIYPGEIDFSRFLHGEMSIKLYQPFPSEAIIKRETEIENIYDKGKGALIVAKSSGVLQDGTQLYDATYGFFYLGKGGFGGETGPKSVIKTPPEGIAPDFSISYQTTENQA
ncbi:MAG: hypothetical protein ACFE8P_06950, partial [Promethearchaeota archaeon]